MKNPMTPEQTLRSLSEKAEGPTWPTEDQFYAEWDRKTSALLAALDPSTVARLCDVVEKARDVAYAGRSEIEDGAVIHELCGALLALDEEAGG